jgi:hypothetical protein
MLSTWSTPFSLQELGVEYLLHEVLNVFEGEVASAFAVDPLESGIGFEGLDPAQFLPESLNSVLAVP